MPTKYENVYESEFGRFDTDMWGIAIAYNDAMTVLDKHCVDEERALDKFVKENDVETVTNEEGIINYLVPHGLEMSFGRVFHRMESARTADKIVPQSLLISLVSTYETFLAGIIRDLLQAKPEICRSFKQSTGAADVFSSIPIEELRANIIDKEMDRFLHENCSGQLKWIEDTMHVPLREHVDNWPAVVEISERRNLFAHTDGVVSQKYVTNCMDAGVQFDPAITPGSHLVVSGDYFTDAWWTLLLAGNEIGILVWRHSMPAESATVDQFANAELIVEPTAQKNYVFAQQFGEYMLRLVPTDTSDLGSAYIRINTARAYRLGGASADCTHILDGVDWSGSSKMIQLGVCAQRGDFDEVIKLMRKLDPLDDVLDVALLEWPVFSEFREFPAFQAAYREVYVEPNLLTSHTPRPDTVEASPQISRSRDV